MKTKTKPDIQKHLEAIAGHKLSADAVERIRFVQAVASSTISDNGVITLRDPTAVTGPGCST
jgi:hypothetical protein